ncbi:GNAT family N-acetyltransferase [Christensenella tenuis]|jgi:GNAT superfamily N-acetyltransferase|uniref:GNAT family N-acetyltransferase n=1 Tax=Christensenella tenuis TaxID=2763033 RepID=A0ABR7EFU6_9FIRM|nr:GNAT family N-acetyltransferase [Christensenella tenuis]MBC5648642.1 GNAT family N-acetyltransferase [Christensenella tenuis]
MEQKLNIRQAQRTDAGLVLAFIQKIAAYEKMSDEVVATVQSIETYVFDQGAAEVLIAEYEGKPVGFALYFENFSTFQGRTGLYLEDLFVDQEMRGLGIGKKLFQAVAAEAVRRGCQRMEWTCLDWNQPSIDFYHAMGAVPMNAWTTYRLAGKRIREAADQ